MNYPDGLSESALCRMEGCVSNPCSRCGETNYAALGYRGALKRWSRVWGVTEEEAGKRFKIPSWRR